MSDPIAYTYDPDKNPDESHLPGVPLRDLTAAEVAALPPWLAASVAACPFYRLKRLHGPPLKGQPGAEPKE